MSKNKGYDPFAADIWSCGVILFIMLAGFPPFQKPNMSDWWFNKLATNKHALFWQAHSRSAYFSEQTKDFINKILNPDPLKRITIADMKKHPWWKGSTVTGAALSAELQRRKQTVDTVKEREKEQKASKEKEQRDGEGDVVMRGMEDGEGPLRVGEDALPVSPPKLTFKNYVFKTPAPAIAGAQEEESAEPEEKVEKAAPRALPEAVRYTRFQSDAAPQKILCRVVDVIRASGGKWDEAKDCYRLQGAFEKTEFVVEIFRDESKTNVVDFRKKQGPSMHFREIYNEIRAQLSDIVLQPKGAAPVPEQAEDES